MLQRYAIKSNTMNTIQLCSNIIPRDWCLDLSSCILSKFCSKFVINENGKVKGTPGWTQMSECFNNVIKTGDNSSNMKHMLFILVLHVLKMLFNTCFSLHARADEPL